MIEMNRRPIRVDGLLEHLGLVRRLAETHAPYAPVQRYVASAEEQRLLSQNDAVDAARGANSEDPVFVAPIFRGDWAYDAPLVEGIEPIRYDEAFTDAYKRTPSPQPARA